jgi:DNA-binding transcriptional ArsR family regulator
VNDFWCIIHGIKQDKVKNYKKMEMEFETFANKHRLVILNYLKKKRSGSVGQIADEIELPFKTTSKHLLYLAKRGILKRRYDGSFVLYKISENLSKTVDLIISQLA